MDTQEQTLADYFLGDYSEGIAYAGSSYRQCIDEAFQQPLLEHPNSGIRVWADVLDLRAAAPERPPVVLYHYTGSEGFAAVTWRGCRPLEIFERLASEAHCFGSGMMANTKAPQDFGSKEEVLINNHWPSATEELSTPSGKPKTLIEWGNARAGPDHPANFWVVDEILAATRRLGKADYCVPLLVPSCFAYSIWERMPPDLRGMDIGCNRFGEKQWAGRDICVVHLSSAGQATLAKADLEPVAAVLQRRFALTETTTGPTSIDTLCCLSDLAAVLHAMGKQKEAEPLMLRVLQGRQGLVAAHHDTQNFHRHLSKVVKGIEKTEEAERRLRSIFLSCEKMLGPGHPYTFAALSNLAALLHSSGRLTEASSLLQDAIEREEAADSNAAGSVHVLKATMELASLYHESGRHQYAVGLLERALQRADKSMGPACSITLHVCNDLAMLQKAMGNEHQAEETLRQVVHRCEANLGLSASETLDAMTELALVLQHVRKAGEAEQLLRRVSNTRDADLGPLHRDAVTSLDNLAVFMKAEGRFQEALPLLQQVLRRLEGSTTASSGSERNSPLSKDFSKEG